MPFVDLPPQLQERVVCSISAAVKYAVPANIVLAVAEKEAGKPGQWVRNSNGTHDVGPMQFNTSYLRDLARYGISVDDVAAAGCYAFDLAAWRIRGHIKNDKGDLWTKAANYHSRTPRYNAVYRSDLRVKAVKWADWLEARFVTVDVTKAGAARALPVTPVLVSVQATRLPAVAAAAATKRQTKVGWEVPEYVPRKLIRNAQP
ncbi:MAG: conjugal transfer protein TrbN [Candidatus Accumulibacter regalis]|uniref:Conjugal transfer protein TrbN n=1 Tax=Accumulibacter regalis TaxID=522306 RepID=A0A011R093_ACCRE|nr:transglycosylase SLT domain-containing protein [Accumulibacter sp.]EXI84539.1 MAG: conjugal transfer protein TrbN [Candidatus Accumulibacter regalis]HRE72673.1 muramidase [Accumulibacter sp.]